MQLRVGEDSCLTLDGDTYMRTLGFMIVYCGFSSHSRIFHSFEDVTITGERLQILTYARHLRLLSSEGHTYCDKGHPFKIVISKASDTHT